MARLTSAQVLKVPIAALVAVAVVIGSAASVAAKAPSKPSPSPSASIATAIAATGILEPSGEYANVDVTVTCPVGWTWSYGRIHVLRGDLGGAGTFDASCTGTPQVGHARVVNGNRFQLGDWTATAYVGIVKSGQQATASSTRTITLQPGVSAKIADEGQLIGTSGGGVSIAIATACPIGATGSASTLTVSQGTATGHASFTPTCDRFTHTVVLSITASQGTFHTGSATAGASVSVGFNGGSFSGADRRTVAVLESSTGDTTPPSTPPNLNANVFGDGETWLDWNASSDNGTPSGLIVYDVLLNGRFDQRIGGGQTQAILYADLGVVNTIDVIAVDGAGNRSAPASVTADCGQSFGCQ
jgi:hypothetical protein